VQGIGRFTYAEVQEKLSKDLDACVTLLKDSQYLTGDTPTQADCFLFALLDWVWHYCSICMRGQN
jgi:glutathione S-transferase